MSAQVRNDRRSRSRFPVQNTRQEWVPRGSPAPVINNPVPNPNANNDNGVGGGHAYDHGFNPSLDNRPHGGSNATRGRIHQPMNPRREKERDGNAAVKEVKDQNLPQLVQEIQDKLSKGSVECMICYDMVRRSAPIWSCTSCYSIFHLNCIKKWARAPTSVDLSVQKNQAFNWRCPGCQLVQHTSSKEIRYLCFCGKRPEPPSDLYLTPHSCGEPCGKPLERHIGGRQEDHCPHLCVLQCHPGPCPPCKAFAPPRPCPCGKKVVTTRCSDRKSVLTCGHPCDKLLETCWNWIQTLLPLFLQACFSTIARLDSARHKFALSTRPWMTNFATVMITTPNLLSTCRTAGVDTIFHCHFTLHDHVSTKNDLHIFIAKARSVNQNLASITRAHMAHPFTLVSEAPPLLCALL